MNLFRNKSSEQILKEKVKNHHFDFQEKHWEQMSQLMARQNKIYVPQSLLTRKIWLNVFLSVDLMLIALLFLGWNFNGESNLSNQYLALQKEENKKHSIQEKPSKSVVKTPSENFSNLKKDEKYNTIISNSKININSENNESLKLKNKINENHSNSNLKFNQANILNDVTNNFSPNKKNYSLVDNIENKTNHPKENTNPILETKPIDETSQKNKKNKIANNAVFKQEKAFSLEQDLPNETQEISEIVNKKTQNIVESKTNNPFIVEENPEYKDEFKNPNITAKFPVECIFSTQIEFIELEHVPPIKINYIEKDSVNKENADLNYKEKLDSTTYNDYINNNKLLNRRFQLGFTLGANHRVYRDPKCNNCTRVNVRVRPGIYASYQFNFKYALQVEAYYKEWTNQTLQAQHTSVSYYQNGSGIVRDSLVNSSTTNKISFLEFPITTEFYFNEKAKILLGFKYAFMLNATGLDDSYREIGGNRSFVENTGNYNYQGFKKFSTGLVIGYEKVHTRGLTFGLRYNQGLGNLTIENWFKENQNLINTDFQVYFKYNLNN